MASISNWRTGGEVKVPALAVVIICLFVGVASVALVSSYNKLSVPITEMRNVEVLETVGTFSYWLKDASGHKIYATFCDTVGYEPPFDKGEVIAVLRFRNIGTCWDMRNMHPKYIMVRDDQGNLVFKEN